MTIRKRARRAEPSKVQNTLGFSLEEYFNQEEEFKALKKKYEEKKEALKEHMESHNLSLLEEDGFKVEVKERFTREIDIEKFRTLLNNDELLFSAIKVSLTDAKRIAPDALVEKSISPEAKRAVSVVIKKEK